MTAEQREEIVAWFLRLDFGGNEQVTVWRKEARVVQDKLRSLLAMEAKAVEIRNKAQECSCRRECACGERMDAADKILAAGDRQVCSVCKNEIDPECCWCGSPVDQHDAMNDGHTAVPMGCTCGYIDAGGK